MYGLFTYIWVVLGGPNVGKIHQSHLSHFLGMQGFPWVYCLSPVNFLFELGRPAEALDDAGRNREIVTWDLLADKKTPPEISHD